MAQFDLHLIQNTAAAGIEFTEKNINLDKGGLLSAIATTKVPTVLAGGTDGYMLVRDDAETTGLKWIAIVVAHTQNTDTGTTSTIFELDNDGHKIELTAESATKLGVKVDGGATYADLQAKDVAAKNLTLSGNLVVNGLTTTVNSNTVTVDDKNVELGSVVEVAGVTGNILTTDALMTGMSSTAGLIPGMTITKTAGTGALTGTPTIVSIDSITQITMSAVAATSGTLTATFGGASDATANGGGITLKGATDKTIIWDNTNSNWTLNQDVNVPTGKVFKINNVDILANKVVGPADAVNDNIAQFNGITGKIIEDSGLSNTDVASAVSLKHAAVTVAAGGGIQLTAQALNLWVTAPATKTSTGTIGMIAKDVNYLYVCIATDTWARTAFATNWV